MTIHVHVRCYQNVNESKTTVKLVFSLTHLPNKIMTQMYSQLCVAIYPILNK